MNNVSIFTFRKMPVRAVERNGENFFVIRDICNILGWSNPNRELAKHTLAKHTENVPLYERIRTPGGLQVVRLVPRADVEKLLAANEKLLAANSGHKALLLERYLRNEVFPRLDAEEKAAAQVRALIVGFISTMHTLMTEQYFADKYHGERNDRCK